MQDSAAALERVFTMYREDLDNYEKKSKPTDGLLGFGRSLKDDPCHDRLDERVEAIMKDLCASQPSPQEAARFAGLLLRDDAGSWPLAAQWMLRAIERHILPLVPFLSPGDAARFLKAYAARYRPWDRLPVQREVFRALKRQAETAKKNP